MATTLTPDRLNGTGTSNSSPPLEPGERPQAPADERRFREWMMIAVGLIGLLSVLAIIVSFVALASKNPSSGTVAAPAPAAPAATAVPPQALTIGIKSDAQHGRMGPDKQWHDAFLPADFSVRAGATVTITIHNYDSGPHTFTSPSLGLNQTIGAGKGLGAPNTVTLKFKAPSTPGQYQWWCALPCDPWAMSHDGYMRGVVTVTA